jgi:uncharacterized membrane protein
MADDTMTTARKLHSIAEISEAELACRMGEAMLGMKRPPGLTAEQALDTVSDDARDALRQAARAAMEYWRECIEQSQRVS